MITVLEFAMFVVRCSPFAKQAVSHQPPALSKNPTFVAGSELRNIGTVPSLRDSIQFHTLPSTPPSASCWAKLFRPCGADLSQLRSTGERPTGVYATVRRKHYSSNPTQCVRFSIFPRFCASVIFCVIQ